MSQTVHICACRWSSTTCPVVCVVVAPKSPKLVCTWHAASGSNDAFQCVLALFLWVFVHLIENCPSCEFSILLPICMYICFYLASHHDLLRANLIALFENTVTHRHAKHLPRNTPHVTLSLSTHFEYAYVFNFYLTGQ